MTDSETRRATGSWSLASPDGTIVATGEGEMRVIDDGLSFGPRSIEHLDADELLTLDRAIEIGVWPSGRIRLEMLGRRWDTFTAALKEARQTKRVEGMLAHGIDAPLRFRGAVVAPEFAAADLLLYPTHLAVAPELGDPWQLPLGAIRAIDHDELDWTVDVEARGMRFRFGQLARDTEKFAIELRRAAGESRNALGAPSSSPFTDGAGIAEREVAGFRDFIARWSSPERNDCASAILARAKEPRLGLVKLLDTDSESLAAREPLPENVAAFLLAPVGALVVLEILSGPSAATYVFEGDVEAINRDLQELHFRRRPLQLSDAELAAPASPYRLAARRLAPLMRLRAATRARIIHDGQWGANFEAAIG
ncbi:MAG: hypothetical protein WC538_11135 [Thermoanaerobaculia bacterium]|jgi:hypothetical protein